MASADGMLADGGRALHRGPPWPDATRVVSNETLAEHGVACPPGGIAACDNGGDCGLCLMAVRRAPQRPPRFACPGVPRALCPVALGPLEIKTFELTI